MDFIPFPKLEAVESDPLLLQPAFLQPLPLTPSSASLTPIFDQFGTGEPSTVIQQTSFKPMLAAPLFATLVCE